MSRCRYWLMGVWFGGAAVVAVILFVQQIGNYYGGDAETAWSWFTPNVVPTLSLMVAVMVATQHRRMRRRAEWSTSRSTG